MSKQTLKSIARRGMMLGAAFAVVAATVVQSVPAYADALNPLTERSLTLSSGSPGWAFTDGSGNSTYAPPNSGANGQKTGNTFAFRTSSAGAVEGLSFQYCTAPAGACMGPGDIPFVGTPGSYTHASNAAALANQQSDLEIVTSSPTEATATFNTSTGAITAVPAPGTAGTNFAVLYNNGGTWQQSTGWAMTTSVNQHLDNYATAGDVADGTSTGKHNYIRLTNGAGENFAAGQQIKVVFFGKDDNYITNPGSKEFFVKINTWNTDTPNTWAPGNAENIDGGVTVANVMNQSIQITTKVLETMDFSVGTVDPYTLEATGSAGSQLNLSEHGGVTHGVCDRILKRMTTADPVNTLRLGDKNAENSLRTDTTYATHSYWRLSSNSSGGATVYYSGVTLSNTVGDKIDPVYSVTPGDGVARAPQVGMEQFGLALANGDIASNAQPWTPVQLGGSGGHMVNYNSETDTGKVYEQGADDTASGIATYGSQGIHSSVTDNGISNLDANPSWHAPRLWPLIPTTNYDDGVGINNTGVNGYGAIDTKYAFSEASNTIPVAIATQNNQVVDCVTGKMRYIANIAATTPAGIYTTKINYIAAPQY